MKGFILDTDTWIEYFRHRSGVEKHIAETPAEQIIVGEFDILIAVTARHYDLTVVTHNTKHFSQMPGIQCVDWVDFANK